MEEVEKIANESLLNDTIRVLEGGVYIQIIEGAVGEFQSDFEENNMDEQADKLMTTTMVLEYLNISRTTLWRLMNQSENALPHLRVGRRLLFRSGDIQN
jgi:predicted DNA-binding transcriptional regulator AlpA